MVTKIKKENKLSIPNIIKSGFSPGSSGREAAMEHKTIFSSTEMARIIRRGTRAAMRPVVRRILEKTSAESIFGRIKLRRERKRIKAK